MAHSFSCHLLSSHTCNHTHMLKLGGMTRKTATGKQGIAKGILLRLWCLFKKTEINTCDTCRDMYTFTVHLTLQRQYVHEQDTLMLSCPSISLMTHIQRHTASQHLCTHGSSINRPPHLLGDFPPTPPSPFLTSDSSPGSRGQGHSSSSLLCPFW